MDKIVKEHCNRCTGSTNHEILYQNTIDYSEEIDDRFSVNGSDTYELLKCCGCDSVQFRHTSWFSEYCEPDGSPYIDVKCYPPPTFRQEPVWLYSLKLSNKEVLFPDLNEPIINLFKEIYIALQNSAPQLAALGIRALIEAIMIDKIGDNGRFEKNIELFENEGFISKKQRLAISPILEFGHAAMHRGYRPLISEVVNIMDVTESIIETIYINENKLSDITKNIPERNRIKKR